jgi:hypothetical protein
MSPKTFSIAARFIGIYAFVAVLVQQGISRLGGATILQEIPTWVFLIFGPMIPLGIGHGIEFFLLASTTCLPLLIYGFVSNTPWKKATLLLAAVFVWLAIGYFLGR